MTKSTMRTVWVRVQEAFRDKGLPHTQKAVAQFLNIKQGSISDWNKPGKGIRLEHAQAIGKRTGVCVEWLYTERGPKYAGPPEDALGARLWKLWPKLSDTARLEAYDAANAALIREGFQKAAPSESSSKAAENANPR